MPPAGAAVAAVSASDVTFARDAIADGKSAHLASDLDHGSAILMTDRHGNGNGLLRPRIPVVNVHIRSADRSFVDRNAYVVGAKDGRRNVLKFDARSSAMFDERFHMSPNSRPVAVKATTAWVSCSCV